MSPKNLKPGEKVLIRHNEGLYIDGKQTGLWAFLLGVFVGMVITLLVGGMLCGT